MRNISYRAIIFGIVSSLVTAEYSGSSNSRGDGYGKSGFDSSYNHGFVGDYAGQLSAGKALGELHGYGELEHASQQYDDGKHGSQQFEEEEESSHSDYSDSFGQQDDDGDDGHKFGNNNFERFSANLDLSKFPIDVEAEHYTGAGLSDIGIGDDEHHQEQHQQYESHQDFQSDDEGDQAAKQHNEQYNPYEESAKSPDYSRYNDHVSMQIVPYSGYEEAEQEEQAEQPGLSLGYEKSKQADDDAKDAKAPSESYSQSYESPKVPSESYSLSYGSAKAPSSSYSSSYTEQKELSPSSYEFVKAASLESYDSHGGKYQYSPSKSFDYMQNVKNLHESMPKDVMAISHGKGGFSYSSLYRS